jgi:hypothetical protein
VPSATGDAFSTISSVRSAIADADQSDSHQAEHYGGATVKHLGRNRQ